MAGSIINLIDVPHIYEAGQDQFGHIARHITIKKEDLENRGIFPNYLARDAYTLVFSDGMEMGCQHREFVYNQDETGKLTTTKGSRYQFGIWYQYNYLTIIY